MTELVITKPSKIDLEPTVDEIEDMAYLEARNAHREFGNYSEWVDFCCMVENQMRRGRGLI